MQSYKYCFALNKNFFCQSNDQLRLHLLPYLVFVWYLCLANFTTLQINTVCSSFNRVKNGGLLIHEN